MKTLAKKICRFTIWIPMVLTMTASAQNNASGQSMAVSAQNIAPRQHIDFDEGWKFHFGNAADP
ncbi:MAG TPA: hypothetical protein VNU72_06805, partial [Puia sp.]|nr:hypothetical protein [Puia sp.]